MLCLDCSDYPGLCSGIPDKPLKIRRPFPLPKELSELRPISTKPIKVITSAPEPPKPVCIYHDPHGFFLIFSGNIFNQHTLVQTYIIFPDKQQLYSSLRYKWRM